MRREPGIIGDGGGWRTDVEPVLPPDDGGVMRWEEWRSGVIVSGDEGEEA